MKLYSHKNMDSWVFNTHSINVELELADTQCDNDFFNNFFKLLQGI